MRSSFLKDFLPSCYDCVLIVLFIPLLVTLRFQDGFVSSAVILLHIYDAKNLDMDLLTNELILMLVGLVQRWSSICTCRALKKS
nr:aromatic acid exporter family protein [Planococcus faecalis]